jgi:membrane fusion protein, multidrug efflux system
MKPHSFLTGLLLVTLAMACGSGTNTPANDSAAAPADVADDAAIAVTLAPVGTVTRAEPIVASGLVSSADEARLSFKVGGIIDKLYVAEGQSIRRGQLLATLNLTEINAQVGQARLQTEKAGRDLARVNKLYADTAATLEQLQNVTTGDNLARQALTIAEFNRSYAQIRASVNGTVVRKLVNEGEYVAAGAGVFQLSGNRPGDWVVRVGVPDKDWARLHPGDRARVTLDAYPGRTFSGTVSELAQAADPQNKLYETEIRIEPGGVRLAPGLFAKVSLLPRQSRAYTLVPVEAIVEGNGRDGFVFLLTPDRKHVRKQPVQIGFLDNDKVLLTSGISASDQVVTGGSAFLTEQSTVTLK